MGRYIDDIRVGDVFTFGEAALSTEDVQAFHTRFAPRLPWDEGDDHGRGERLAAAQAHVYALWSRMLYEFTEDWPVIARLGQDHLRWYKTAYAGDVLGVRMTFMAKETLDVRRGVVVSQHDVLNQHGELVMALLTRAVVAARPDAV